MLRTFCSFFFFFLHFVLDVCIVIIISLFPRVLLIIFMSAVPLSPLMHGWWCSLRTYEHFFHSEGNEFGFSLQGLESWSGSENWKLSSKVCIEAEKQLEKKSGGWCSLFFLLVSCFLLIFLCFFLFLLYFWTALNVCYV